MARSRTTARRKTRRRRRPQFLQPPPPPAPCLPFLLCHLFPSIFNLDDPVPSQNSLHAPQMGERRKKKKKMKKKKRRRRKECDPNGYFGLTRAAQKLSNAAQNLHFIAQDLEHCAKEIEEPTPILQPTVLDSKNQEANRRPPPSPRPAHQESIFKPSPSPQPKRAVKTLPVVSPYFKNPAPQPTQTKVQKRKPKKGPTISPYFSQPTSPGPKIVDPFSQIPTPPGLPFALTTPSSPLKLMQESILTSLYALILQSSLFTKTRGTSARPVLFKLLTTYPTPSALAAAPLEDVTAMIKPLGLHSRAARLIEMAKIWVAAPPSREKRYRRPHYPNRGDGLGVRTNEILEEEDRRQGWEVAHLPGVGPYGIDSFRIFYRDTLRGVGGDVEPEWKRVVPQDKELRAYLHWKWREEGWDWDVYTGNRVPLSENGKRDGMGDNREDDMEEDMEDDDDVEDDMEHDMDLGS